MALQNGRLSSNLLTGIGGGRQLQIGAAVHWAAIQSEVYRRYGWTPQLSAGASAYRTYNQQVALFTQRYSQRNTGVDYRFWNGKNWWRKPGYASAATPGTSNHGLGVAIDVAGLGGFGSPRYTQFATVATQHQYNNNEGKRISEHWHWVYTGSNEKDEDDMPLTEDDINRIALRVWGYRGTESRDAWSILRDIPRIRVKTDAYLDHKVSEVVTKILNAVGSVIWGFKRAAGAGRKADKIDAIQMLADTSTVTTGKAPDTIKHPSERKNPTDF